MGKIYYHGSPYKFNEFKQKPWKAFDNKIIISPIWLTEDKNFAKLHAGSNGWVYTVSVKVNSIFPRLDLFVTKGNYLEPTEYGEKLLNDMIKRNMFDLSEDDWYDAEQILKSISNLDYSILETGDFINWLKDNNYDAFYVRGDGPKNLAVLNKNDVEIINIEDMSEKGSVNEEIKNIINEEIEKIKYGKILSEGLKYHFKNNISICNNIYRPFSEKFYSLFVETRELYKKGKIKLSKEEISLIETDIGEFGIYEGKRVPLDFPMTKEQHLIEAEYQGKDVELNKPKRGGAKKFYVYVKCGDKVKKVSFGSANMPLRVSEPERRKAFKARHNCEDKNDKCTAGYWSCRIGRYPNLTGAKKSYTWW